MAVRSLMWMGASCLVLSACASQVPDSGAGVGFTDYATYQLQQSQREAALTGAAVAPGTALPGAPIAATTTVVPPGGIPQSDLAAAGIGVAPVTTAPLGAPLSATSLTNGQDPGRSTGVQASPGNAAPALVTGSTSAGISDEQDFDAVASRESIESDAARRAEQAAQYQVIQPTALPDAPASTGPNIVAYALAAPNRVGQEWYSRFMLSGQGRFERNCASYRSPDEAQRDFLINGGPERDPRGVDPDGDGFACGWDPAPFLAAVGRN
jgi:hypothetical protein